MTPGDCLESLYLEQFDLVLHGLLGYICLKEYNGTSS